LKHYELVPGDYVQSGDEFFSKKYNSWLPISSDLYGAKYGFDPVDPSKPTKWTRVRRLVPDSFGVKNVGVPIQEQWGEDV
jgi:hypothetical protein